MLGFSPDYVERITPNEREIFKGMYMQEQKEKQSQNDRNSGQTIGAGIEGT